MLLRQVLEFLIVFILISFAASRTIDSKSTLPTHKHGKVKHKGKQNGPNRFCSCTTKLCKCCGEFNVPVVNVKGPGCASLQYKKGDRLGMLISFGERIITNTTITGRSPQSICLPLPSGVSKFCGRVYNIGRENDDFVACLGLELRSLQNIEASLRVSCFRFGPQGLRLEPAQPLPAIPLSSGDEDDDDDDDEYDFDDDDDDEEGDDKDNDLDSIDYGTFALDDDFVGNLFVESGNKKKPVKKVVTTTRAPLVIRTQKRTRKPIVSTTQKIIKKKPSKQVISTTKRPTQAIEKIPTTAIVQAIIPQKAATTTTTATTTVTKLESTSEKNTKFESVPLITHESIASVSTMLQDLPKEPISDSPLPSTPDTPTKIENVLNISTANASLENISAETESTPTENNFSQNAPITFVNNQPITSILPQLAAEEPSVRNNTVTTANNDFATETVKISDTTQTADNDITVTTPTIVETTTLIEALLESSNNLVDKLNISSKHDSLVKNTRKEDEDENDSDYLDDDDSGENDDDEDDDDDDIMSPITSVVADVLGDEEDEKKSSKPNGSSLRRNEKIKQRQ